MIVALLACCWWKGEEEEEEEVEGGVKGSEDGMGWDGMREWGSGGVVRHSWLGQCSRAALGVADIGCLVVCLFFVVVVVVVWLACGDVVVTLW